MTTLLQEWLHNQVPSPEDKDHLAYINGTLAGICPRYVFKESLAELYVEMLKNDQITWDMVCAGLRDTGSEPIWIETVLGCEDKDSLMIGQTFSGGLVSHRYGTFYVDMIESICGVNGLPPQFRNYEMDGTAYFAGELTYETNGRAQGNVRLSGLTMRRLQLTQNVDVQKISVEIGRSYLNLIFGLFLIQQPKVYTLQNIKPDDKLQKSRAKKGKKPLPDYTIVNLTIGQAEAKRLYDAGLETGTKRRYHYVMGHFRHIGDKIIWISAHYRGDASLGMVKREVHVTVGERP